ncbi:MAG: hypothetical protein ACE5HQ_04335 [Gemmatimonadota bacterium]
MRFEEAKARALRDPRSRCRDPRSWRGRRPTAACGRTWPVCLAIGLGAIWPGTAWSQLRRDPTVQPIGTVRKGDVLVGLGVRYSADAEFPLSGLSGDLFSVGRLTLAYGLAERVLIELRGDVYQVLSIDSAGPSAVPLDAGVADGTTTDVGDFRLSMLFAPIGSSDGFSAGARVEVKLPNSDETRGIGTNTTDFRLGLLGSYGQGALRVTADVGVAILEAPLENFQQNDVLAYGAELLYSVAGGRGRLALGTDGRASTRGHVPLGTEDLGELRVGGDYRSGVWLLDAGVGLGYADASPDWTVSVGLGYAVGQGRTGR